MAFLLSRDNRIITYKNKFLSGKTLAELTWAEIKHKCNIGAAPQTWIGQTKSIQVNGQSYDIRCVDVTEGRYTKANGSYTHATFEFVQTLPTLYAFETNLTFENSTVFAALQGDIFNSLPSDLKSVIDPVKVKVVDNIDTEPTERDVQCYLFLVSIAEAFDFSNMSSSYPESRYRKETYSFKTNLALNEWDYYKTNTSSTTNLLASKSSQYWLRSGTYFDLRPSVKTNGTYIFTDSNCYAAPCFSL